jgi:phospholipase/carboxylesterase
MDAHESPPAWQHDAVFVRWYAHYRVLLPSEPAPGSGYPVLLALHGFGENADRFATRLAALAGSPYAIVIPDGPFPVELRDEEGARIGCAWYQYDGDAMRFEQALSFGAAHLEEVLQAASARWPIDAERVVLLGYSQGGYVGAVAALRNRARYRGLIAIATRIKHEILEQELADARGYPVLALHGERDRATPLEPQRRSLEVLEQAGLEVELVVHPGGHGFRSELLPPIDSFVRRVLSCGPPPA